MVQWMNGALDAVRCEEWSAASGAHQGRQAQARGQARQAGQGRAAAQLPGRPLKARKKGTKGAESVAA